MVGQVELRACQSKPGELRQQPPNQNPLTDPIVNPATASNSVNVVTGTSSSTVPQLNVTANATGNYVSPSVGPEIVNGWPINVPPIVDPLGTVAWLMGLPEQTRGTAQTTVTGVVGPVVEPPQPPNVITQQPVFTVQMPTPGAAAVAPAPAAAPDGTGRKAAKVRLKLSPYNGEDHLETFLAKFRYMGQYLQWSERDKFHHFCASLRGEAGQVLWDRTSDATTDSVIKLLRTRFGNELHIERFRAELRARWRKCGEPLQSLYLDIVRMTTLAHPQGDADLTRHVAREAFINSLGDNELQMNIMEKQPATIDEALSIAIRLEAYEAALRLIEAPQAEASKGEAATKSKTVNAIRSSASTTGRQL